jgi:hypothetical protein
MAPFSQLYEYLTKYEPDFADILARAHKFFLDRETITKEIFDCATDYGKQLWEHGLLELPFDTCAFASYKDNGNIQVALTWKNLDNGNRILTRIYAIIPGKMMTKIGGYPLTVGFKIVTGEEAEVGSKIDDDATLHPDFNISDFERKVAGFLTGIIGCLETRGISQSDIKAPKHTNKLRAAKGKAPLFEHKRVYVDMNSFRIPGMLGTGMTHASPRLHWRRGHVRRLPDGRLTAVRPCLVGAPENGTISHEYMVRNLLQ